MSEFEKNIFLNTFFNNDIKLIDLYRKSIVYPQDFFKQHLNKFRPIENQKKIVIVDGHPRTGKTWISLSAVDKLIHEYDHPDVNWWTTGHDSELISDDSEETIYDCLLKVCKSLEQVETNKLKFVFIDDLFGTNIFRNPCNLNQVEELANFFRWTNENPILKLIPNECVLIFTSRSLFLFLIEEFLNKYLTGDNKIFLTPPENEPLETESSEKDKQYLKTSILPEYIRWGVFRKKFAYEITGVYDIEDLRQIKLKIEEFHPFFKNRKYLALNAPLYEFIDYNYADIDKKKEEEKQDENQKLLNEETRKIASRVFFEEDMTTLLEQTKSINTDALKKAYLMTIAPGLLFLGESAYKALLITDAKKFSNILYYNDDRIKSGRLANEFYMIAVNIHLREENFGDAIKIVSDTLLQSIQNSNLDYSPKNLGIAIKGLIERVIVNEENPNVNLDKIKNLPIYKNFIDSCTDILIKFELDISLDLSKSLNLEPSFLDSLKPGLAASLIWIANRSKIHKNSPAVVKKVNNLFDTIIVKLIYLYLEIYSKENSSLKINEIQDKLMIFYSVFLQWTLKFRNEFSLKSIKRLIYYRKFIDEYELPKKLAFVPIIRKADVILKDELLWFYCSNSENLHVKFEYSEEQEFNIFTENQKTYNRYKYSKEIANRTSYKFSLANFYFSSIWHNDWMYQLKKESNMGFEFKQKFDELLVWVKEFEDEMYIILEETPDILDFNFKYHWLHFITQRSTWKRDWVFHENPLIFETECSQIAIGSKDDVDQLYLLDLMEKLVKVSLQDLTNVQNLIRLKYIVLFIGARSAIVESDDNRPILDKLDFILIELKKLSNKNADVFIEITQAIFELAQQGFLEFWSKRTSYKFRKWCIEEILKEKLEEIDSPLIKKAWGKYFTDIENFSHDYDLLPDENEGWRYMLPIYFSEDGKMVWPEKEVIEDSF